MLGKCGEDSYGFYDRKGWYFREGVDPRNHVGRFVTDEVARGQWVHADGCSFHWSINCDCGAPLNA